VRAQLEKSGFLHCAAHDEMTFLMVWRRQATATTNANAGVLRFAQNDKSFEVSDKNTTALTMVL
jgi:hypothetical protein